MLDDSRCFREKKRISGRGGRWKRPGEKAEGKREWREREREKKMSGYGDEEEDFTIERQRKGSESRDFTFSWTRKPPRFQPVHENPTVPFTAHCRSLTYGGNFMVSPASGESSGNIGYGDRAYTPIPFLEHEFDEEHTSSRDS